MLKKIRFIFIFMLTLVVTPAFAILKIQLTRWVNQTIPIAVVAFAGQSNNPSDPSDVSAVINNDLQNSGRFKVLENGSFNQFPDTPQAINMSYWQSKDIDYMAVGRVQSLGGNQYRVTASLVGVFTSTDKAKGQRVVFSKEFTVGRDQLRPVAHHISDLIYKQLVGTPGIFSTRIAYVVVRNPATSSTQYVLEVADVDGYNPQPLLTSKQPIMSPSWSPDGKQLAYVSFENDYSQIYVQNVASGSRRLLTSFKGINGAPSWSPDGRKLALVLSKTGNAKIYSIDVGSSALQQLTKGYSIDTEPSWSPDGRSIIFTSDRGGGPQIYQLNVASGDVQRLTYSGKYNAKANFTPDGSSIIMMHQDEEGNFDIAQQNLQNGTIKLLTRAQLDESPSVAPNGSMVLYASNQGSGEQLAIVSTDGHVKLQLPNREGNVQSPAWSPFLS